jgi:hypothetical protein
MDEDTAFCDALAENGSAKEVMKSDSLGTKGVGLGFGGDQVPRATSLKRRRAAAIQRRRWTSTAFGLPGSEYIDVSAVLALSIPPYPLALLTGVP